MSSDTIFACIFCPFSTQLHFTFLTPPFSLCLSLLCFSFYAFTLTNKTTRTQFDWYNWSPNNSSTGLLTFRNSPVVVPLHPDPAPEPPPPPLNAPTTQSSGLPGCGAQVGVRPLHEGFKSSKGSSLLPQQDQPDQLPPCNKPRPLTLQEMRHFQPEQGRLSHHPPGSQQHRSTGSS